MKFNVLVKLSKLKRWSRNVRRITDTLFSGFLDRIQKPASRPATQSAVRSDSLFSGSASLCGPILCSLALLLGVAKFFGLRERLRRAPHRVSPPHRVVSAPTEQSSCADRSSAVGDRHPFLRFSYSKPGKPGDHSNLKSAKRAASFATTNAASRRRVY